MAFRKQFVAGWEVRLDGSQHCKSYIKNQLIDEATAKNLDSYIELQFDSNNLLSNVKLFSEGVQDDSSVLFRNLKANEAIGKLKYEDLEVNQLYDLEESGEGKSYLGGRPPAAFQMPDNNCPGSFQYLGKLSQLDQAFNWLVFDLHLICPIYLDIGNVWIDYKNPLEPKIINIEEINSLGTAYDDLKDNSFIIFEEVRFKTVQSSYYGFAGVPNWIQFPDIPLCPESGRAMKFLCQIGDDIAVKVSSTNVHPKVDWYKSYFREMNFWGDGDLFVFFEPETKIACYFIQNT